MGDWFDDRPASSRDSLPCSSLPHRAAATSVVCSTKLQLSERGGDEGCTFHPLHCGQCHAEVGAIYRTTIASLDAMRDMFTFFSANVSSYQLGTGEPAVSPAAEHQASSRQAASGSTDPVAATARLPSLPAQVRDLQDRVKPLEEFAEVSRAEMAKVQSLLLALSDVVEQLDAGPAGGVGGAGYLNSPSASPPGMARMKASAMYSPGAVAPMGGPRTPKTSPAESAAHPDKRDGKRDAKRRRPRADGTSPARSSKRARTVSTTAPTRIQPTTVTTAGTAPSEPSSTVVTTTGHSGKKGHRERRKSGPEDSEGEWYEVSPRRPGGSSLASLASNHRGGTRQPPKQKQRQRQRQRESSDEEEDSDSGSEAEEVDV